METKAERLDHLQEALEVPDMLHSVGSSWTCYIQWSRGVGKASWPTEFSETSGESQQLAVEGRSVPVVEERDVYNSEF